MSKRPYRDFDLPTRHLINKKHFTPPKARDSAEIERRRQLPTGVLIAEYQYKGIAMATMMLQLVKDQPDIKSLDQFLAPSALNTSAYCFGLDKPVMRSRLKLAVLDADDPEQRPSSFMLRQEAIDNLSLATDKSYRIIDMTATKPELAPAQNSKLARLVGHAALVIDCIDMGDDIGYGKIQGTDFELSEMSRKRGLHTLQQARTLELALGEPPSLAGLADPDSTISVFTRREGTNNVKIAYEEAYETMISAA